MTSVWNEWESMNALKEGLRSTATRAVVVGEDAEAPRKFYICELQAAEVESVAIGIVLSWFDIPPMVKMFAASTVAAIMHDSCVSFVDLRHVELIGTQQLDSVAYQLMLLDESNWMLVIHELGVASFDSKGSQKWSVSSPDIVEDWEFLKENSILLNCADDQSLVVDIVSGSIRKHR